MKDILNSILLLIIGTIFGIIIHATCQAHVQNYHISTTNPNQIEYVYIPYPQPVETEEEIIEETFYREISEEDCELLEQIAMAEAEGENTKGKALVMLVVLNRAEKTGKTIREVIFQQGAFYTAGMKPGNDDAHEALAMVLEGWDESEGALYFCSTGWNKFGDTHLFKYGGHWFSK